MNNERSITFNIDADDTPTNRNVLSGILRDPDLCIGNSSVRYLSYAEFKAGRILFEVICVMPGMQRFKWISDGNSIVRPTKFDRHNKPSIFSVLTRKLSDVFEGIKCGCGTELANCELHALLPDLFDID